MSNQIYCMVFSGTPLNDFVRSMLFVEAQKLMNSRKRAMRISDDGLCLTGIIKTDYKLQMLGTTSGFVFKAEFEWNGGESKVDFITKPISDDLIDRILKIGKWSNALPNQFAWQQPENN